MTTRRKGSDRMSRFEAGLDGVTFESRGCKLLGGLYKAAGEGPRPTAILLHGVPGVEKQLDLAYALRDRGWNCLYFHFRGSWGSEGSYSFAGLAEDAEAAVEWVLRQPSVDQDRIALIGGSMGGYTSFLYGASDPRIRAIVGVTPLVEPRTFELTAAVAGEFASMLNGVRGEDLLEQWAELPSLTDRIPSLTSRSILLVTGDRDELFPPSHYTEFLAALPEGRWERAEEGDHALSTCRPWLVRTVTEWLLETLGS
jgi:dipeptidyl aminopeptidase/acylaminoacyl peptidase